MDLDFGHGFIPRIGTDNYRAVDRCTGPTTLFDTALDLPSAIVDGAWAEPKVELLKALKEHGTKLLVDTAGWRYRYDATLEIRKLREASWAPATAITMTDRKGVAALVRASMRAQATIGADAYLLPGWLPETPTEDLIGVYETILETASSFDDVDAKPLVQFVGGHTKGIDEVVRILDHLPHFVSAVYLQLSPIHPAKDSPSKLEALADVYRHVAQGGFKVIAGHAGAIAPHLRSLGIDAGGRRARDIRNLRSVEGPSATDAKRREFERRRPTLADVLRSTRHVTRRQGHRAVDDGARSRGRAHRLPAPVSSLPAGPSARSGTRTLAVDPGGGSCPRGVPSGHDARQFRLRADAKSALGPLEGEQRTRGCRSATASAHPDRQSPCVVLTYARRTARGVGGRLRVRTHWSAEGTAHRRSSSAMRRSIAEAMTPGRLFATC